MSHSQRWLPSWKWSGVTFVNVHLNLFSLYYLSCSNLYHVLTNTHTYVQNNTLYSSRPSFILLNCQEKPCASPFYSHCDLTQLRRKENIVTMPRNILSYSHHQRLPLIIIRTTAK